MPFNIPQLNQPPITPFSGLRQSIESGANIGLGLRGARASEEANRIGLLKSGQERQDRQTQQTFENKLAVAKQQYGVLAAQAKGAVTIDQELKKINEMGTLYNQFGSSRIEPFDINTDQAILNEAREAVSNIAKINQRLPTTKDATIRESLNDELESESRKLEVLSKKGRELLKQTKELTAPPEPTFEQKAITTREQDVQKEKGIRALGADAPAEVVAPVLTKAIQLGLDSLNPAEKQIYQSHLAKGIGVKEGLVDTVIDKPFKTAIQKEIFATRKSLDSLKEIEKAFKPEFFTLIGRGRGKISRIADQLDENLLPEEGVFSKKFLRGEVSAKRRAEESFNIYKKNITGVQFSVKELEFLKKAWPVPDDSPTVFKAKLDDVIDSHYRSIARLMRFGSSETVPSGEKVFAISLSDISDEEIDRAKAISAGGRTRTTPPADLSTDRGLDDFLR